MIKSMRSILKSITVILECVAVTVLSLLFSLSVYAISDNNQVFSDTEAIQKVLQKVKPADGEGDEPPNFDDLRAINPDVCGWITVDGTNIDYPVLQGSSNLTYLNKDVYGNFSLAGSIFLDASNDNLFRDRYSLMYGHHMDQHMMFGDLDLFKDSEFFQQNRNATLITKKESVKMQVLAIMETFDSTEEIFHPTMWDGDISQLIAFINDHSMYVDSNVYEMVLDNKDSIQIVALATCTDGATGNRTVLFLVAKKGTVSEVDDTDQDEPEINQPDKPDDSVSVRPPAKTGDELSDSPYFWLTVFAGSMMSMLILLTIRRRQL